MRRVGFVFIILALIYGSAIAFNVEDYMPLAVGNRWITRDSSAWGVDTTTSEIIETTTMFEYLTYVFEDRNSEGVDTTYMQYRPDGLYSIEWEVDAEDWWIMRVVQDPFFVGNEWVIFVRDTSWSEESYTYEQYMRLDGEVVGLENINVTAGYFSDCVKITMTGFYKIEVQMGGTVVWSDSASIGEHSMWFAQYVGPVQFYDYEPEDSIEVFSELIAYRCTAVDDIPVQLPAEMFINVYPNPFNPSCRIEAPAGTQIEVFDIRGTLVDNGESGSDDSYFFQPPSNLGSGIYLVRASAPGIEKTKRIIYLK